MAAKQSLLGLLTAGTPTAAWAPTQSANAPLTALMKRLAVGGALSVAMAGAHAEMYYGATGDVSTSAAATPISWETSAPRIQESLKQLNQHLWAPYGIMAYDDTRHLPVVMDGGGDKGDYCLLVGKPPAVNANIPSWTASQMIDCLSSDAGPKLNPNERFMGGFILETMIRGAPEYVRSAHTYSMNVDPMKANAFDMATARYRAYLGHHGLQNIHANSPAALVSMVKEMAVERVTPSQVSTSVKDGTAVGGLGADGMETGAASAPPTPAPGAAAKGYYNYDYLLTLPPDSPLRKLNRIVNSDDVVKLTIVKDQVLDAIKICEGRLGSRGAGSGMLNSLKSKIESWGAYAANLSLEASSLKSQANAVTTNEVKRLEDRFNSAVDQSKDMALTAMAMVRLGKDREALFFLSDASDAIRQARAQDPAIAVLERDTLTKVSAEMRQTLDKTRSPDAPSAREPSPFPEQPEETGATSGFGLT